ncbi:hypothetical protein [Nocardia asteroides]|uniref:hypothetical protein n=1 Tax=Nocardia asteroides TaxID=1824 RepID=UPI001E436BF6|nr:hypothetical protein [Nocardia asteroides]UGT55057.1 hypothetical protein LTT85_31470 [Nocardia asteroides]
MDDNRKAPVVKDTAPHRIIALLGGDFDFARCEAGCRLPIRATVAYLDSSAGQLTITTGDAVDVRRFEDARSESDLTVHFVDSVASLRDHVKVRLREHLQVLAPIEADGLSAMQDHWREFTPQVFAAIGVAVRGGHWDLGIRPLQWTADSLKDLVDSLYRIQNWVWIAMLLEWELNDTGSLEEDLRHYVDEVPIVAGAAKLFTANFAELSDLCGWADRPTSAYRALACLASVHHNQGTPNPRADDWAISWLVFEAAKESHLAVGRRVENPIWAVSKERVRATVPPDSARFACDVLIAADSPLPKMFHPGATLYQLLAWIEPVFREYGFGALWNSVIQDMMPDIPLERVADEIITDFRYREIGKKNAYRFVREQMCRQLVRARRVEDIRRIFDALMEVAEPGEQVEIRLWFWESLAAMYRFQLLLDEVGVAPQPGEDSLPLPARARLLTLRASALLSVQRGEQALRLLDSAPQQILDEAGERENLIVLRARLLKDQGLPAAAMTLLEDLLNKCPKPFPVLYESLAATAMRLGRQPAAAWYARQAFEVAMTDRSRYPVRRFAAVAMMVQSFYGGPFDEDLFELVTSYDIETEPFAAVMAAHAVLNRPAEPTAEQREFLDVVAGLAWEIAAAAMRDGDRIVTAIALGVGALYDERYRHDRALASWTRVDSMTGSGMSPTWRIYWAANHVSAGNCAAARAQMRLALDTQAVELGFDADFADSAFGGAHLAPAVDALSSALFASPATTASDLRVAGELRRGWASRGIRSGTYGRSSHGRDLDDAAVSVVAPAAGRVAVFECVSDGSASRAVLTVVDAAGDVVSDTVELPQIDLANISRRLQHRLSNWHRNRPGDPFDSPEWRRCSSWLGSHLRDRLDGDDHLVVVPFEGWHGMPWHVAAFEHVSCSYEPSWTALFDTVAALPCRPYNEGILAVPRIGDATEVHEAIDRYIEQARRSHRGPLSVVEGNTADQRRVSDLIGSVGLMTLITHGFLDMEENELALMVAANGSLPLSHAVAANSDYGRAHRFGWEQFSQLRTGPQVMLSAACSTGSGHVVGLGERLGIYNVVRRNGLRSFVAPQWDITAADVLPILSEIRGLHGGGLGLGACVRQAARTAVDRGVPAWLANSLALEGDWR